MESSGELAVVGVLYRLGGANPALQTLIDAAPQPGGSADAASPFDASAYPPARTGHYAYTGSLTTPPCTEGVRWFGMDGVGEVSEEQLQRIAVLTNNSANNRPIQPLHDRVITRVAGPWASRRRRLPDGLVVAGGHSISPATVMTAHAYVSRV